MDIRDQSSGIDLLESILKWGSVAYGLGFLTVLLNTAKLGIPTLELIEPVQVWVGIPLAIIFWLVITVYKYFRRNAAGLRNDLALIKEQHAALQQLAEYGDISEATARLTEFLIKDTIAATVPFVRVAWVSTWDSSALRFLAAKTATAFTNATSKQNAREQLGKLLSRVARMLGWVQRVFVVSNFFNEAITAGLILAVVTYLYIFIAYPKVPPRWGGGAPVTVSLVVAEDKIPSEDAEIATMFPSRSGCPLVSKATRTKPIQLLYATKDAYYLRMDDGKLIRLNAESVGAVLFEKVVH